MEELDGGEVALALDYRRRRRSLSLPDSFALALAKTRSWTLLSGDGELRKLAAERKVACHGVLWLIDWIFEDGEEDGDKPCAGLRAVAAHPRCRLPKSEIRKRIRSWCLRLS